MVPISAFEQLPPENLVQIFNYLEVEEIVKFKKTCRRFRDVFLKNARCFKRNPCWVYIIAERADQLDVLSGLCVFFSKGRRFHLVAHFGKEIRLIDETDPSRPIQVRYLQVNDAYNLAMFLGFIVRQRKIEVLDLSESNREFSQTERQSLLNFFAQTKETVGSLAISTPTAEWPEWEELFKFTNRSFPFNLMPLDVIENSFPIDILEPNLLNQPIEKRYLGNADNLLQKTQLESLYIYGTRELGNNCFEFITEQSHSIDCHRTQPLFPKMLITANEIGIEQNVELQDWISYRQKSTLEENYLQVLAFYLKRFHIKTLSMTDFHRHRGIDELQWMIRSVKKHQTKIEEFLWNGDCVGEEVVELVNITVFQSEIYCLMAQQFRFCPHNIFSSTGCFKAAENKCHLRSTR